MDKVRTLLDDLDAHLTNMDGPKKAHKTHVSLPDLVNGVRNRVKEARTALTDANRAEADVKVSLDNKPAR